MDFNGVCEIRDQDGWMENGSKRAEEGQFCSWYVFGTSLLVITVKYGVTDGLASSCG